MTYEEIMAQANNSGMSAEEFQRRDQLVRNVQQHNPELAAQIARGPYRMQQGSAPPTPTAQGSGVSDRARGYNAPPPQTPSAPSASVMRSPSVTPTGVRTIQGPPTQAGAYPTASQPADSYPPRQTSVGNPRYDSPAQTQQPVININVGESAGFSRQGYGPVDQQATTQQPTQQAGFSRQGYGGAQGPGASDRARGYSPFAPIAPNDPYSYMPPSPLGNPSAMHNQDYPMSPNFGGPMQPSGYATSMWDNNYMRNNPGGPKPVTVLGMDGSQQNYNESTGGWDTMPPTFGNLSR